MPSCILKLVDTKQTENAFEGFSSFVGFEQEHSKYCENILWQYTHCKVFERVKNEEIVNCVASKIACLRGMASFHIGLYFDMKELFWERLLIILWFHVTIG